MKTCTSLDHCYPSTEKGARCHCGRRQWGIMPTGRDVTPVTIDITITPTRIASVDTERRRTPPQRPARIVHEPRIVERPRQTNTVIDEKQIADRLVDFLGGKRG